MEGELRLPLRQLLRKPPPVMYHAISAQCVSCTASSDSGKEATAAVSVNAMILPVTVKTDPCAESTVQMDFRKAAMAATFAHALNCDHYVLLRFILNLI